jgi:hypothetical protein
MIERKRANFVSDEANFAVGSGNPAKNLTTYETKFAACSQLMEFPTSSKVIIKNMQWRIDE